LLKAMNFPQALGTVTSYLEKLREVHQLVVSRSVVRQVRLALGRPATRRRSPPKHRSRRPRKPALGQLAQLDASPFARFEERGPAATLHGLIDDATSTPLALWFRPNEDLHGYVAVLDRTCRTYGLPLELAAASGELQPGGRAKAASVVMPMAVSPDRRFLYAASRSKPFSVHVYSINRGTGALTHLSTSPLAESFPYISLDKTGRFLLGASYGGHLVSVNAVGSDGRVAAEPLQVIPVGRNAHSIRVDESNKFAYLPTLGSDQIFQFNFDAKSGRLSSNTPAVNLMKATTGPRHFVTSADNKFLYALSELHATVTSLALDGKTGLLTEVSAASGLPPDSKLMPGAPRGAVGGPGAPPPCSGSSTSTRPEKAPTGSRSSVSTELAVA
jgi:Lactonase, 7-bladed beta-propeller